MTAAPERNQQAAQELAQVRAEAVVQPATDIVAEVLQNVAKADEVKRVVDDLVNRQHRAPDRFEGDPGDENSMNAKATAVKETVQKVLFAVQPAINKELVPVGRSISPDVVDSANEVIRALSNNINPGQVSEQTAPYLYHIINSSLTGQLRSSDDLVRELNSISHLAEASPELYRRVQKAFVEYAMQVEHLPEGQANAKFHYQENTAQDQDQNESQQRREALNPDEEKTLGNLLVRIKAGSENVAKGEQLVKSLIHTGDIDPAALESRLEALGFQDGERGDIINLSSKVRAFNRSVAGTSAEYRYLKDHKLLTPDLLRLYTVEGVEQFLVPDEKGEGHVKLSDLGRRVLKKQALFTLNSLLKNVDNHPDSDFQAYWSDLREGYAYFDLEQMVKSLQQGIADSPQLRARLGKENAKELDEFISKGVVQELAREKSMRELFHTLGIYIKTLAPEKIAEFVQRYNLSDIDSIVTSDFSGKIISSAMSEYERYLAFDRMKNKGQLRTSLFAGKSHLDLMYKDNDDRTRLKDRLKATLEGLQEYVSTGGTLTDANKDIITKGSLIHRYDLDNIEGFEDWELDRALKYAQGIHLTQTIRGFEIIASGRPPEHFRGSADNMIDMAGVLNPYWRWQLGRGGDRKMPLYRELLKAQLLVKRPEMSLIKRIFGDNWNPGELHEKFKGGKWHEDEWAKQWETIEDKWLYKDMNFQQMIKILGLGGLGGRFGWRGTGFSQGTDGSLSEFQEYASAIQSAIEGAVNDFTGSQFAFAKDGKRWVETYDQLARSVGVGSRFFFDTDRAKDFTKIELWRQLGINPDQHAARELDQIWDDYTYGKYGTKEIVTLPDGEKVTTMELMEIKTLMFRGQNFQALLERAPLDFLNSLINITPELLTPGLGGVGDEYFIFEEGPLRAAIAAKESTRGGQEELYKKIKTKQIDMRRMWGESNYGQLKYIRSFYSKIEAWGNEQGNDCKTGGVVDREKVFEKLFGVMDLATEKVKLRNAPIMSMSDIGNARLAEIFLGTDGLVTHFKDLHENFGADTELGQKGFFYHMGRAWYNELGNQFPPDTSDVDWRFILHNMGAHSGENMVTRLWKDLHAYNGVMTKLMGLDDLLHKCAQSHSLEELYKLHGEIRNLKGISGDEACYEMNFHIAQIAARYFQEHHNARLPFLLGKVYSALNGKELALSKIYGGPWAMTLKTDGLNAYFQTLALHDMIAQEGIYGFDRLAISLGADWQKMVVSEIIPNISTALILFLLAKWMKDANDETEGKKKK